MDLFYRQEGSQNAQSLLILHGFLGSADNWLTLGRQFAQKYAVFLIDQRNHGRSFGSPNFDYDYLADDLAEFIEKKQLQNPYLIGHSMGGKVLINFAKKYPQIAQKLVIADMGIKKNRLTQGKILEGLHSIDLNKLESRQEAETLLANYEPDLGTRQFLLKSLYRTDKGEFAWRFNLPVLSQSISKILDQIELEKPILTPSLFIRGTKSDYVLDSDKAEIQGFFVNAHFEDIEAGHWLHAEKPMEFFEKVSRFLEK